MDKQPTIGRNEESDSSSNVSVIYLSEKKRSLSLTFLNEFNSESLQSSNQGISKIFCGI